MAAANPKSLLDGTLINRDKLRSLHGFIIKITSGVIYSTVIHFFIFAAYSSLSYQVNHRYEQIVKDPLSNLGHCIFNVCAWFGVVEIGCLLPYWYDNPQLVSKIRHLMHIFVFMFLNTVGVAPLKPTQALTLLYVGGPLMFWTFIVAVNVTIHLAFLEDDSLSQPLV